MSFRLLLLIAGSGAALAAGAASAQVPAAPPSQMPAMSAMAPGDGYRLGANDEIEVTTFGVGQNGGTPQKVRVKEDGTITLALIGTVSVRDQTARELSVAIAEKLRVGGYFTRPVVNVEVTQYVSNSVTVFGEVATAGVYPLDRPLTVGMMIARAGGGKPNGADYAVLKRANDPVEHRVLFSDLTGDWSASTALAPGDTIYVPVVPQIFVYGQVNSPGAYGIQSGMTVRQALARAGGPTLAGTQRKISIFRDGKEMKKISLDDLVKEGDTMFIHERLF